MNEIYGYRGEKPPAGEIILPQGGTGGVMPKGGSGTAPPKGRGEDMQSINQMNKALRDCKPVPLLSEQLAGAFAVPDDYRELLKFSVGIGGWFVPDEVRRQAAKALQELVFLRTLRDVPKKS